MPQRAVFANRKGIFRGAHGVLRVEPNRFGEVGKGLVVFALLSIGDASLVAGCFVLWDLMDCLAVVGDGFVEVALAIVATKSEKVTRTAKSDILRLKSECCAYNPCRPLSTFVSFPESSTGHP